MNSASFANIPKYFALVFILNVLSILASSSSVRTIYVLDNKEKNKKSVTQSVDIAAIVNDTFSCMQ